MRSQSLPVLLKSEAKKRPEIAALLERVETLTDEEIAAAPGLPWVRKALHQARDIAEVNDPRFIERIMGRVRTGFVADPEGILAQWGMESWMVIERGNQLLMPEGTLVFLPETGGAWLGSIFVEHVTPALLTNTRMVGRTTKSGYAIARREGIMAANPELKDAPTAHDPDDRGLFRIIRH